VLYLVLEVVYIPIDGAHFLLGAIRTGAMDPNALTNERPKKVFTAVTMLYVTVGIEALRIILYPSPYTKFMRAGVLTSTAFIGLGIYLLLIVMISRRRNWARITYRVLFLLGVLPTISTLTPSLSASPLSGFLRLAPFVLQVVALMFLFQQQSSEWFRAKATRHKQEHG